MARNAAKPGAISGQELNQIADHVARHQEADGGWLAPPPANGPSPVFESRETMTLWACLALGPQASANPNEPPAVQTSRDKAAAWRNQTPPADTTQATALRLLVELREAEAHAPGLLQPGIERLLARQNADGGWNQIKDLPSDAYSTGQSLYVLNLAGVQSDRNEVQRGVSFLVGNQREDGSWPMTPRTTPERPASKNVVPITYFGSAWATMGLIRSVPR